MEVAREVVATITDPSAMVGPEVISIATVTHTCNYTCNENIVSCF